jgi:hypothetical protein
VRLKRGNNSVFQKQWSGFFRPRFTDNTMKRQKILSKGNNPAATTTYQNE